MIAADSSVVIAALASYWLDSVVALLIAVVVGYHAARLMRRVLADLREKPRNRPNQGPTPYTK